MKNNYAVRCGVRYVYGILFPYLFLNELLEKHGIMRSQFQEPKFPQIPHILKQ